MYCGCPHTAINLSEPNPAARAICPACGMIMQPEMRERRLAYWLSVVLAALGYDPMQGVATQPAAVPAPLPGSQAASPAQPATQQAASEAPKIIGLPAAVKTGWTFQTGTTDGLSFDALNDEQKAEVRASNPAWNDAELARVRWFNLSVKKIAPPLSVSDRPKVDVALVALLNSFSGTSHREPRLWLACDGDNGDGYEWSDLWTKAQAEIIAEQAGRKLEDLAKVRWLNPSKGWMGQGKPVEPRHLTDVSSPFPESMLHDNPPVEMLQAELKAQRDENAALKAALLAANGRAPAPAVEPNGSAVDAPDVTVTAPLAGVGG